MRALLVEDEGPKRDHILSFLRRVVPSLEVETARSVRSAVAAIRERPPDLLLLDMSLPTFDQGPDEPGGRPQGFGGIEVMRHMERYDVSAPVVVVTAYEAFALDGQSIDLRALRDQLLNEHPTLFRGLVYFNSVFGDWDKALEQILAEVLPSALGGTA